MRIRESIRRLTAIVRVAEKNMHRIKTTLTRLSGFWLCGGHVAITDGGGWIYMVMLHHPMMAVLAYLK